MVCNLQDVTNKRHAADERVAIRLASKHGIWWHSTAQRSAYAPAQGAPPGSADKTHARARRLAASSSAAGAAGAMAHHVPGGSCGVSAPAANGSLSRCHFAHAV